MSKYDDFNLDVQSSKQGWIPGEDRSCWGCPSAALPCEEKTANYTRSKRCMEQ